MLSTLILLYALDSTIAIPQGCFIAAWVLVGVEIALRIFLAIAKVVNGDLNCPHQ